MTRLGPAICSFVLAASALAACAARRSPSDRADAADLIARADGLARAGCYECLREAATIYEALPASIARGTVTRRVETLLLLALRSRELDLGGNWLAQADQLLAQTAAPELRVYRAIVDQIRRPAAVASAEELEAEAEKPVRRGKAW